MKKIERYIIDTSCECGRYGDDVNSFEDKVGDWCKSDAVAKLESTIEELVGMLVENLKFVEKTGQGWNYYEQKQYLETITGKTWDKLKEERG